MDLEIGQVLTQIVAFLIMLWILKRFAWKPLLGIMEERRDKIKAEFHSIDDQKREIQRLTNEYNDKLKQIEFEAKAKIQEAVNQGNELARQIQAETQQQAKAILNKAQDDVQKEIAKAKIHLKNDLVNMTIAATEKMLNEELDTKKQKKLLAEFVEQADFE